MNGNVVTLSVPVIQLAPLYITLSIDDGIAPDHHIHYLPIHAGVAPDHAVSA